MPAVIVVSCLLFACAVTAAGVVLWLKLKPHYCKELFSLPIVTGNINNSANNSNFAGGGRGGCDRGYSYLGGGSTAGGGGGSTTSTSLLLPFRKGSTQQGDSSLKVRSGDIIALKYVSMYDVTFSYLVM